MEFDLSNKILSGKRVLFEGAQGTFLDVNFGTVPFVTSSNTIAAGVCAGAGVGPTAIGKTTVVFKSYLTRVGNGPFSTEFLEKDNFLDYSKDREHGTTTGRKRRAGWFDAVLGKYSVALNGADEIALTKLDILDKVPKIKVCVAYKVDGKLLNDLDFETIRSLDKVEPVYEDLPGWNQSTTHIRKYEDLPENARKYIERISELCGAPINIISVGPDRDQTIFKF